MIRELLRPESVVVGMRGEFPRALEGLLARLTVAERAEEIRTALVLDGVERVLFVAPDIAIPHAQLEGLAAPEMVLGIASSGVVLGNRTIHLILLLLTPTQETERHLQLLQRLLSLLPEIRDDLVAQRDPLQALRILAAGETRPGIATYLNLTQEQVALELHTDLASGLSSAEAARRRVLHGPNQLERTRRIPITIRLLKNLFSFFALLLWTAGLLCFVPGVNMPQLGVAILVVIFVNGLFAFFQEARSDRAVEALEKMMPRRSRVVRDGRSLEVDAATLVPGDIILLEEGDIVPADARLIEAAEVEVDNSTLTGESTSARRYKSDQPLLLSGRFLWIELPNIVFSGTALVRGRARAVVFGTGMRSEVGRIARLTQQIPLEASPLQKQLRGTVLAISALAGALGIGFLLLGSLVAGLSFTQAFIFFIGIFVANVPEGLLPTVTLSLAMGVTRMARRNALVKDLPAVETLGCTTVICCDKTGTLTQNVMMARELYVDGRVVEVTGKGYSPRGEFLLDGRALSLEELSRWTALRRLLECACVCNNARIERAGSEYRVSGDPTEGALMALSAKAGLGGLHQRLHVNPFESVRKRMSVVARIGGHDGRIIYAKGAPLEMLERCDRILRGGEVRPLEDSDRRRVTDENDALARRGLRILALAYREDPPAAEAVPPEIDAIENQLVFLGLAAMSDPIRPGVPEAIQTCRTAGIRVVMITGDYGLTAASIAHQMGLVDADHPTILTGAQISDMSDRQIKDALAGGAAIFARVSPEHKLRIVSLLKEMGEIVAVTGDGVNDAPALKKADVGIAMGLRGNDVAREAADLILLDDNFGTIVAAIEEGRAIYDNIRKFAAYVLNSNPQEIYPYVLWMLVPGMPLAMTVMGVLAVDVGTDLIPAMGLGIEPPEPGVMERPPRRRGEKLLSLRFVLRSYFVQGSLLAMSCFATYFYMGWVQGTWRPGLSPATMPSSPEGLRLEGASFGYLQTLTAYFFPIVTTQIANVLCKRSWKTSLFSPDFLPAEHRQEILAGLRDWQPVWLPEKISRQLASPLRPLMKAASGVLENHPVLFNLVSNPLIDMGIVVGLGLCVLFFYTPFSRIYFFAPVPWHVYLFAFHGTLLLLVFEETKKYLRRRGYPLEWLG